MLVAKGSVFESAADRDDPISSVEAVGIVVLRMNAKSRVHAALRREPVGRVPVWVWFHPDTTRRLSEWLQVARDLRTRAGRFT